MQNSAIGAPLSIQQIRSTFQKYGLSLNSMIPKQTMFKILDSEHQRKRGTQMSQQLTDQIWEQCECNSKGEVPVSTIAGIVMQAQSILSERIQALGGQGGMIENIDRNIKEKQLEVKEYMEYYSDDRERNNQLTKELINMQIQQKQNQHDLSAFKQDYLILQTVFSDQAIRYNPVDTQIINPQQNYSNFNNFNSQNGQNYSQPPALPPQQFEQAQIIQSPLMNSIPQSTIQHQNNNPSLVYSSSQQKSKRLLTLFHLTCLLAVLQFLIMSSLRVSMFPLTVYLHSFYILCLGIYQRNSVMYLIGHCFMSVLGDLVFVVLRLIDRWELMPIRNGNFYGIVMIVLLFVSIGLRIVFIVLLFTFKDVAHAQKMHYFVIFGNKFTLNSQYNQIQGQPQNQYIPSQPQEQWPQIQIRPPPQVPQNTNYLQPF